MSGIQTNPLIPASVKTEVSTAIQGGIPFLSDAQLTTALSQAGVDSATSNEIVAVNVAARLTALRSAFALAALLALLSLFLTGRIPTVAPGSTDAGQNQRGPDGVREAAG